VEVITADFETYYDKEYSLKKMTTEAYIRDPRFETIMLGLRWPDGKQEVLTGTHEEIRYRLDAVDWSQYAILCHNTLFDAAIFSWHFGVKPRAWLDTLSMARAMFGSRNNSLAMLAKRYNMEDKGTFVANMSGRRRDDISPGEWKQYSEYCLHDVALCYDLWHLMSNGWYGVEAVFAYLIKTTGTKTVPEVTISIVVPSAIDASPIPKRSREIRYRSRASLARRAL